MEDEKIEWVGLGELKEEKREIKTGEWEKRIDSIKRRMNRC